MSPILQAILGWLCRQSSTTRLNLFPHNKLICIIMQSGQVCVGMCVKENARWAVFENLLSMEVEEIEGDKSIYFMELHFLEKGDEANQVKIRKTGVLSYSNVSLETALAYTMAMQKISEHHRTPFAEVLQSCSEHMSLYNNSPVDLEKWNAYIELSDEEKNDVFWNTMLGVIPGEDEEDTEYEDEIEEETEDGEEEEYYDEDEEDDEHYN
jgi:hypothetical protein